MEEVPQEVPLVTPNSASPDSTPDDGVMTTHLEASSPADLRRRYMTLIAVGIFVTSFAQPNKAALGDQPFKYFLKTTLHAGKTEIAGFFTIAALFWYLKPLAGIFTDSVPLLGTRRRWYLVFSAFLAGFLWIALKFVPPTYRSLLYIVVAINALMVVASTVIGGLLVEAGQRYSATGRVTSLRFVVSSIATFIVGPLGGWLATHNIAITVGIGAFCLFALGIVAWVFLREKPVAQRDRNAGRNVAHQFRTLVRARSLWWAVACYALFYFAPGFGTPLYFYQTDTLKLSQQFIGNLGLFAGGSGLLGALLYAAVCRKLTMRQLLTACVIVSIFCTLLYEFYHSPATIIGIETIGGFGSTIVDLALLDLAARATPRGSEALGYGLMMSIRNVMVGGGDVLGSWLTDKHHIAFSNLVLLNAGTTALVLLIIPFLPRLLMSRRDGDTDEAPTEAQIEASS